MHYYVNKLRQNVGLETWKWRQIVTSQAAQTKYKWPPYDPYPKTPMKIFCVHHCFLNGAPHAYFGVHRAHRLKSAAVACLGYGRLGTCHGRHFDGGAKFAWQKWNSLFTVSWTSICAPYIHKLQSCSYTAPLRRAFCASTTMHYDKLWYYDITRRLVRHYDIKRTLTSHSNVTSSFSRNRKG